MPWKMQAGKIILLHAKWYTSIVGFFFFFFLKGVPSSLKIDCNKEIAPD